MQECSGVGGKLEHTIVLPHVPAAQHPHPLAGLLCLALPRRHSLTASTAMYACTLPCIFPVIIRSAGCICRKSRNKPWAYFSGHQCTISMYTVLGAYPDCCSETVKISFRCITTPLSSTFLRRFTVVSLVAVSEHMGHNDHSAHFSTAWQRAGLRRYVNNMGMTCTLQVNACHMSCKDNSTRYHRT